MGCEALPCHADERQGAVVAHNPVAILPNPARTNCNDTKIVEISDKISLTCEIIHLITVVIVSLPERFPVDIVTSKLW